MRRRAPTNVSIPARGEKRGLGDDAERRDTLEESETLMQEVPVFARLPRTLCCLLNEIHLCPRLDNARDFAQIG